MKLRMGLRVFWTSRLKLPMWATAAAPQTEFDVLHSTLPLCAESVGCVLHARHGPVGTDAAQ